MAASISMTPLTFLQGIDSTENALHDLSCRHPPEMLGRSGHSSNPAQFFAVGELIVFDANSKRQI
jgi:hypothetical protein